MERSIWFPTGTAGFSIQIESTPGLFEGDSKILISSQSPFLFHSSCLGTLSSHSGDADDNVNFKKKNVYFSRKFSYFLNLVNS